MLKLGGYLNLLISLLHFAALLRLEEAFLITGVSGRMAQAAAVWQPLPLVLTLLVALLFAAFGVYALAGAGVVKPRLPWIKPILYTIAAVYIIRGLAGLAFYYTDEIPDFLQTLFSLAALGIGLLYLLGTWSAFSRNS